MYDLYLFEITCIQAVFRIILVQLIGIPAGS
jgi:hypothetical protein